MKGLRFKDVALAFDWHDQAYYGKPALGVLGTKPKLGSSHAFSFLTASILTAGKRLVLCIVPLQSREGLPALLSLIAHIERWVDGFAYVAFDNGFQNSELILSLQQLQIPFILALRETGKLKRRRRWMRYAERFTYTTQGVTVDVVEAVDWKGWKYHLATNLPYTAERVLRLYKRRWGIETSYRKIREFLPKTTSRNWTVRIFNFIFACLIYNAWVILNAKAREHVTTLEIKLTHFLNYILTYLTIQLTETAGPPR